LTTVIKTAFDTDYGLYKETAEHKFYPNPSYIDLFPNEEGDLYGFIGRIVGKSLYDGIQIEPQFAKFFLRKVLRLKNYCDDVSSLDQQLFQSLMQLKKFTAEQLAELELTFCVSRAAGDQITVIDLIPDGRDVLVTSDNVRQYIYKVCDYYVNHSIEGHTKAFVNGLSDVLQPGWLQMFAADELQLLISGDEDVDVSDLKKNTNYVGGFSETHEEIKWFWELVEKDFSLEQRKQLIKFATSVPRAPLQGFATLNPKFCVQRTVTSDDMLPTAGTCMNMLRLPRYSSKAVLREKLVYAIESQSGFALS
jgi:ubiquitin-protein ligase E3 C